MPESAPQATSAPPLIIISYSVEDQKWKDQLVSFFPKNVELDLRVDRLDGEAQAGLSLVQQLVSLIDEKFTKRAVLVVLLSPNYLRQSWIYTQQSNRVLDLERRYGLKILPVLLHDCPLLDVPFLRDRQVITSDGKPIAETSPTEQATALQNVVSQILEAAGVGEPPAQKSSEKTPPPSHLSETLSAKVLEEFTWTTEVEKILDGAKALGLDKDGRTTISPLTLLFAFAEAGRLNPSDTKTPQFLWGEITRHGVSFYDEAFNSEFPQGRTPRVRKGTTRPSLRLTRDAVELLEVATSLSLQTIKLLPPAPNIPPPLSSGYIAGRHLLAAFMLGRASTSTVLETITDLEGLRRRLFDIIEKSDLPDDRNEWRSILEIDEAKPESTTADHPLSSPETEAELMGKADPTHIEETETDEFLKPILAGFATDYWIGKDLLNIEGDVNALASLVAAWSVEPPLSIGLFGDWGSGKSHFMRQMRQQVERLSRSACKSPKKQNEIGYYKNIVQIEFNAWHYIEGNLWASLVDHIFANLRVSEKEADDIVTARQNELMTKLGVKEDIEKKLKSKIEERKTELAAKSTEVIARATDAGTRKADASTALAGFRNEAESQLNQLEIPIRFSDEDQQLLQRFGIQPSALQTAGDIRKQYQNARTFWNRISTQWKLFWTDPKVKRRWFLAALLALIPLAGGYLLTKVPESFKLPAGIVTVFGFIATFLNAAKPAWEQFRKGLKLLEEQDAAIELERQKRIAELQAEVNALTKTILDAENEAKSIRTEITDLENQISNTTASTILGEFIEDRAAASDYRRHLGLLALIRRDFEKLRDLFDQQRLEEKRGQETHHQNRINRIILYIDDLDRCGPKRVVEVLQAIHLLLAFPIFVVVVGVDARWVTRSLQESYEWLRLEDDDDGKRETNDDPDERSERGATPHDYLEKIFQIPFWLAPMGETQCQTFIEGLTEQVRYKPPDNAVEDSNGSNAQTTIANTEGKQETPASGNGNQNAAVGPLDKQPAIENVESTLGQPNVSQMSTAVEHSGNVRASESLSAEVQSQTRIELSEDPQDTEPSSERVNSESGDHDHQRADGDEPVDLSPQSLTLGDKEIEYMTSLAKLIGRSPRAVKRFLNCYRLIKVSLPPASLKKFVQDGASYEYRAVMILLGIITGAPTASQYVIEELENWTWSSKTAPTLKNFLNKLEKNTDLTRTADWPRLKVFLTGFDDDSAEMFSAVKAITPRVSRFSFRSARADAAGPKRPGPPSRSKAPQPAGSSPNGAA
ncbi:MAG TPA: P-loop NTPase fold protein [Pyrinomonadaceae bacterium]|nr:P-loop NTPase fold protein [Pyrinomonadaceae bacterium]